MKFASLNRSPNPSPNTHPLLQSLRKHGESHPLFICLMSGMSFRLSVKSEPLGFARVSSTPNPKAVCRFDFVSCESQPKNGVIHKTAFSQTYVWNDNPCSVSLGKPLTLDEVFIRAQPKGALQVDIRHCFRGRLLRSAFRCVLLHSRAWRVEVRPPCRQLAPELQKSKQLEI